jgi:peptidoglycan/LPS O-acetylase OafA/YrhL
MSQPNLLTRIPSLDGLRAISIALVLHGHLLGTRNYWGPELMAWQGDTGNLGVRIFFVISGFLITNLLLEERERTGAIDLKAFYIRRAFRIFPAFYAYILVLALAIAMGWLDVPVRDLVHASTYTINFVTERRWQVGHLWSLAVEEQFYLLWPALLVLVGVRNGLFAVIVVILGTPFVRVAWSYVFPEHRAWIGEAFPTVCDTLATGCLLALIRPRLDRSTVYRQVLQWPGFALVPLAAVIVNAQLVRFTRVHWLLGETLVNLAIAVTIDWAIRHPTSRVGSLLNARPLVYVGMLSYSLYLWQQPLLNRYSPSWWCEFPQNVVFAGLAAVLSYSLIERPLLEWRRRLMRRRHEADPDSSTALQLRNLQ